MRYLTSAERTEELQVTKGTVSQRGWRVATSETDIVKAKCGGGRSRSCKVGTELSCVLGSRDFCCGAVCVREHKSKQKMG